MTIWIRSYLRAPLERTTDEMEGLLAQSDWWMFAENQGLDDDEGPRTKERFRIEAIEDRPGGYFIRYREDPEWFIRADHWIGEAARGEIAETLESDPPAVRPILAECIESFGFALKQSDADGMGWPICFHLAMEMARLRGGLIRADGSWWDPTSFDEIA